MIFSPLAISTMMKAAHTPDEVHLLQEALRLAAATPNAADVPPTPINVGEVLNELKVRVMQVHYLRTSPPPLINPHPPGS